MIEKWALIPVAICVVALIALVSLALMVGVPVPMMAGPEDAR
jgi:hypothetical protein